MADKPLKAFVYCRTSKQKEYDEEEKVSIEDQEEACLKLAEKEGYKVVEVFKEPNRNSWTYPEGFERTDDTIIANLAKECGLTPKQRTRAQFGALLKRLNEVDVILCRKHDRIMRVPLLSDLDGVVLRHLLDKKVTIHSVVDGHIDPNNPRHVQIFKIHNMFSSGDLEARRQETIKALKTKRDKGELYTPPDFCGFRSAGKQQVQRIPEEIKIVKLVFKKYLAGESINKITRYLNDHYPTTGLKRDKPDKKKGIKKKRHWPESTIRSMLRRRAYNGHQLSSDGERKIDMTKYFGKVISDEDFEAVQKIFAENKKNHRFRAGGPARPLAGLCRCGYCNHSLYGTALYHTNKTLGKRLKVRYFHCHRGKITGEHKECAGLTIKERLPDGIPLEKAGHFSLGLEECLFPLIFKAYIMVLSEQAQKPDALKHLNSLRENLNKNLEFQNVLTKKLEQGILDDPSYDDKIKPKVQEAASLRKEIEKLEREIEDFELIDIPSMEFEDFASRKVPDDVKRQLFQRIIDRVEVTREEVKVVLEDKRWFALARYKTPDGKKWELPRWEMFPTNFERIKEVARDDGLLEIVEEAGPITKDTQFNVVYLYPGNAPVKRVYENGAMQVLTMGEEGWTDPTTGRLK